jgi:hypothetical protein
LLSVELLKRIEQLVLHFLYCLRRALIQAQENHQLSNSTETGSRENDLCFGRKADMQLNQFFVH